MRLIINKLKEVEQFFRFSPHICQSYGIDFYTTDDFYTTKEMPNDAMSALGLLSLDEVLTRHVYANYDERSIPIEEIKEFVKVDNDPDNIMEIVIRAIANVKNGEA